MMKQLLITRQEDAVLSSLFEEKELIQVHIEDKKEQSKIGNIYVAKVKNIVKNIEAAFVEIEGKEMCFLSLRKENMPIFCNVKKNTKICIGDEILVQVMTDGIKTKNPTVTTNLSFSGKYIVLTHGKLHMGISNKLVDKSERERLMGICEKFPNSTCGYIVRTNAAKVEEELLVEEAQTLFDLYQQIIKTGICKSCFSCVYQGIPEYLSDIRNGYSCELDEIVTDDSELYEEIKEFLQTHQREDLRKLRWYEDAQISLNRLYSLETKIFKALKERVWLKSGGYLVIQPTEALTVIDVNTGKAISGKKPTEETFLRVNTEAAEEIAKQLRLRNLSGIIVVDFIDMLKEKNRKQLITHLSQLIEKDPVKTVFVDMTKLNLVELTRQKVRKPLHEQIFYDKGELHLCSEKRNDSCEEDIRNI